MKNSLPKIQIFLSVAFFIACSLAALYIYKETTRNNQEAEARQDEIAAADYAKDEVKLLNDSIKSIESEKSALESHFVKSSNVVPFLDSIEGAAKVVGVKSEVASVEVSPEHDALLVELDASGSFPLVYKFLRLLETSPYELSLTSVTLERSTSMDVKGTAPRWDAKFKIKVLSFVP
jgi:hypothetical protein